MKRYIYHSPFKGNKKPRVTVVGLLHDDETISFGVSRCSEKDMFSRRVGRNLAEMRARLRKKESVKLDSRLITNKEYMDRLFYSISKVLASIVEKNPQVINPKIDKKDPVFLSL